MSLTRLRNNQEHDIVLSYTSKENVITNAIIPATIEDPDDRQKKLFGFGEIDSAALESLRKDNKVVQHYFNEGWLVVHTGSPQPKQKAN